jgi:hypothetical protein
MTGGLVGRETSGAAGDRQGATNEEDAMALWTWWTGDALPVLAAIDGFGAGSTRESCRPS